MEVPAVNRFLDAAGKVPALDLKTLEELLSSLLPYEIKVLSEWAGKPHQVLSAQFLCYAKAASHLRSEHTSSSKTFDQVMNAALKAPHAPTKKEVKDNAATAA